MRINQRIPRYLNTFANMHNPKGDKNMLLLLFPSLTVSFLLYRNIQFNRINYQTGVYVDPLKEHGPHIFNFE
jgi:hypothetical protein